MYVPLPLPFPIVTRLIQLVIGCLILAMIIRVILSWLQINENNNAFVRFLARLTDPFIEPCRRIVGQVWILDLSFWIAWFMLIILETLLLQSVAPLGW